ncbi:MAG: polysaccharide deacetylase family protein, partial [bacterium]
MFFFNKKPKPAETPTFNKSLCFYFQVHQPYRLSDCSFFNGPEHTNYFDGPQTCRNETVFNKVADKCYIPATEMFLDLVKKNKSLKLTYSLSGVFLEQCEEFGEKGKYVLDLFRELHQTGQVEFLAETYYHSLAFLYSKFEYAEHIKQHSEALKRLFNAKPTVFRNTELIYNNELAE